LAITNPPCSSVSLR